MRCRQFTPACRLKAWARCLPQPLVTSMGVLVTRLYLPPHGTLPRWLVRFTHLRRSPSMPYPLPGGRLVVNCPTGAMWPCGSITRSRHVWIYVLARPRRVLRVQRASHPRCGPGEGPSPVRLLPYPGPSTRIAGRLPAVLRRLVVPSQHGLCATPGASLDLITDKSPAHRPVGKQKPCSEKAAYAVRRSTQDQQPCP